MILSMNKNYMNQKFLVQIPGHSFQIILQMYCCRGEQEVLDYSKQTLLVMPQQILRINAELLRGCMLSITGCKVQNDFQQEGIVKINQYKWGGLTEVI